MKQSDAQRTVFFIIALTHLFAILAGEKTAVLVTATKPLLLPALMFIFYNETGGARSAFARTVLAALFFSWAGDVLLLFQEKAGGWFMAGLLSFLVAHCFFTIAFLKTPVSGSSLLLRKPWLVLPFAAFGAGVYLLIGPGLFDLKIPVLVYMAVILLMALSALNRWQRVPGNSFVLVFTGALFFLASDSLLAINKFRVSFPWASFSIMLTYITAQYLLVKGSVMQVNDESRLAEPAGSAGRAR